MAGTAVRIWFKQLRRLQSLKHAVAASKMTPSAIAYRVELWHSIRQSPGFYPTFPLWWQERVHQVDGVPTTLPRSVPTESVITQAMYDSFLLHFRDFERWHLHERSRSLKMKYEGSLDAICMDLRSDPKPGVDNLWTDECYTILAVDEEGSQIQVDRAVQNSFDSVWYHGSNIVDLHSPHGDICTVSTLENLSPGDELRQRVMMPDTNDILTALADHWKPRWNNMAQISDVDWNRIVGFASHYMPKLDFSLPPLCVSTWRSIVKKFKRRSARGPDGFSHHDLRHMPDAYVVPLLGLLNSIENTDTPWPQQLAFGTVLGLGKNDDPHEVSHFRPITLFSVLYRAWSRLRTRQLLQQIAKYMPSEALGFLPHRETTEVWLQLQAIVELMLQHQCDYAGLSTDLKRAFNNIGRAQVNYVATHLGFPPNLMRAWNKFLNQVVRRFDVHSCLGEPLASTSGYPEGCPLSIVAMLTVNWSYHIYMRSFCPEVTAYSFVDNLTLAAAQAHLVIQAFFALKTVCELFGLSIDDDKTYTWALLTPSRRTMQNFGFPCLTDASELGGAMTYGLSRRTRVLRQRGQTLQPRWTKLRRSMAPIMQKITILPKVFWPQGLHGSSNCVIADNYADQLRKDAVKALGLSGAGSNPVLRLSLMDDMQTDPGYYQIQLCFSTFRRMTRKSPDLVAWWKIWFRDYWGQQTPGPFYRLMQCMQTLGWTIVDPPFFRDHEAFEWDLTTMNHKALTMQLEDAWLQHVASRTNHRTMRDLHGLDGYLTLLDSKTLTSLERMRLSALHSGAFMSEYEHAKYDAEKTGFCTIGGCEDDRLHWLQCPRYQHLRDDIEGWRTDNVELPSCTIYHLLVPRMPCLVEWRQMLAELPQDPSFLVNPPEAGVVNLFLDGSCFQEGHSVLKHASWAVVDATTAQLVAASPLSGIVQTIDRAELTSMLMALLWTSGTAVELGLWSDSQSTVKIADHIFLYDDVPEGVANMDLWLQIHRHLRERQHLVTRIRWIPAHLSLATAEDPFEEWAIHWNDVADRAARQANLERPAEFHNMYQRITHHLDNWTCRVRQLRQFYFQVASYESQRKTQPTEVTFVEDDSSADEWLWIPWGESLPLSWEQQCLADPGKLPGAFHVAITHWIQAAENFPGRTRQLSDLELVFALTLDQEFSFPFLIPGSSQYQMRTLPSLFEKPTLATLLRPVQFSMAWLGQRFPMTVIRTAPQPNVKLGVNMKLAGTRVHVPHQLWTAICERITSLTARRAIRRANDLARPIS